MKNDFDIVELMWLMRERKRKGVISIEGVPPLTFKGYGKDLKNYRIYGNTVNGESVGNLVTDSQSEHYGNYAIPITNNSETANIYLDKPLRMVGDEAEYVDYATQKWHRVRKNLLQNTATSQTINGVTFTVNNDGSVTCNGTSSAMIQYNINTASLLNITENVILSGCPSSGSSSTFLLRGLYLFDYTTSNDDGNGVLINRIGEQIRAQIRIASGYTCNNLTFFPIIRRAEIEDDTYEPYIENTEVDVTLPEIAVTAGTNTLTVGTEVQPSKVEIKGRIKQV